MDIVYILVKFYHDLAVSFIRPKHAALALRGTDSLQLALKMKGYTNLASNLHRALGYFREEKLTLQLVHREFVQYLASYMVLDEGQPFHWYNLPT